ncbi:MAG: hypothetical protein ACR2HR_18460 [Euzebya sp.]
MRKGIAVVLAVFSGAGMAYGIIDLTTVFSVERCATGNCTVGGSSVPLLVVASLVFFVAVFLWQGSWLIAPPVGLLTALGLSIRNGTEFTTATLGTSAFIALSVLLGPLILAGIWIWSRRRRGVVASLVAEGSKAIAQVQGASETGVYINNRPQVAVSYLIRPLDGSQPFAYQQRRTLSITEVVPRPGLTWPAWYRPGDTSKVAIGSPSGNAWDPQTQALLTEFGIPVVQAYGYDPTAGQQQGFTQPGAQGFSPSGAPPGLGQP